MLFCNVFKNNYVKADDDWNSHPEIKAMLYLYKVHEKKQSTDKKRMYQTISNQLRQVFQYSRTPEAIENQMNKLKENYKEAVDNAGPRKTGTGPIKCEHFEVIHMFV